MKVFIKRTLIIFEWLILSILVGIAIIALLPVLPTNKYVKTFIVPTGSMQPTISVGSLAFVDPNIKKFSDEDIIAFIDPQDKQKTVLHRIIGIQHLHKIQSFYTKGDNNNTADPWVVSKSLIRGKYLFSLPYIGYFMAYAKTKIGFFLFVGVPAVLLLLMEFLHIKEGIEEEVEKRTKEKVPYGFTLSLFLLFVSITCISVTLPQTVHAQGLFVTGKSIGSLSLNIINDNRPSISLIVLNGYVYFVLTHVENFTGFHYELSYNTQTILQSVDGEETLQGGSMFVLPPILLGSCSAGGTCVMDKNVHNLKLRVVLSGKNNSSSILLASK